MLHRPYWESPATRWRFFGRLTGREDPEACHMWDGPPDPSTGYGQLNWTDVGGKKRVHVVAWEIEHQQEVPVDQEIGRKLDIDHTCHNADVSCPGGKVCRHRLCCNPRHLEIKKNQHNKRAADEPRGRGAFRETFDCGHPASPENTYVINRKAPRGSGKARVPERRCKRCTREKQAKS